MGVSSLDDNEFVLNIDDITNIVDALEVYMAHERFQSISQNRDFYRGIQSTYSYFRDFENFLKRSDFLHVKLSYCI